MNTNNNSRLPASLPLALPEWPLLRSWPWAGVVACVAAVVATVVAEGPTVEVGPEDPTDIDRPEPGEAGWLIGPDGEGSLRHTSAALTEEAVVDAISWAGAGAGAATGLWAAKTAASSSTTPPARAWSCGVPVALAGSMRRSWRSCRVPGRARTTTATCTICNKIGGGN